jgi:hypothetical protein
VAAVASAAVTAISFSARAATAGTAGHRAPHGGQFMGLAALTAPLSRCISRISKHNFSYRELSK